MSNNKNIISVDVLYGYSKNEESLPTEWFTTIQYSTMTEGVILWVKCVARYVDGSVEEMITAHYVASDENTDVNNSNNNEYTYVITMITFNCGEIYNTGVIGAYDTVQDAEDAISHLCRNKQERLKEPHKNWYCVGFYEYYPKPSEGYKFIIDKLKKNKAIGATLSDVVMSMD